jgi:hypothetical protein
MAFSKTPLLWRVPHYFSRAFVEYSGPIDYLAVDEDLDKLVIADPGHHRLAFLKSHQPPTLSPPTPSFANST